MKKYYIADTWNGEGYTNSGLINTTFEDKGKANDAAYDEFKDRYLSSLGKFTVDNKLYKDDGYIGYSDGNDSGAIHVIETDDSTVGMLLQPCLNDVKALTGDEFTNLFKDILNNIDNDEDRENFLQEMLQVGNSDAHTDHGYFILYRL